VFSVADKKHVNRLQKGVLKWNTWRLGNAQLPDLSDADLSDAELSGADLSGADLRDASLNRAHLTQANLSGACLSGHQPKRRLLDRH
jgi:uncharacterized protein YjbI with pentapeptide repeats